MVVVIVAHSSHAVELYVVSLRYLFKVPSSVYRLSICAAPLVSIFFNGRD